MKRKRMQKKLEALKLFESGVAKKEIARRFDVSPRTVRRWIVSLTENNEPAKPKLLQKEHADRRADFLRSSIITTLTSSNYPVINPECLVVESRIDKVYNYSTGEVSEQSRAPRTYVTDFLKVEPIVDCRNKTFFFTRAQNATKVDENLLANMQAYAKHLNASIVVGPDTYQTSWFAESDPECREYDDSIKDYLCFGRFEIGDNFFFAGEMNILTTASTPINDLLAYSLGKWCVVPHSKQQLESIPVTDPSTKSHQILTTGSITVPKVIPRKAGIKSIFHHIMGFVVVEFDSEGRVFCRHVNSEEDGSFYDLWWRVEKGKVRKANQEKDRPDYIMPGDIHRAKLDRANQNDVLTTFGFAPNGNVKDQNLISLLNPRRLILQDLHDGEVDSHYTWDDLGAKVELASRNRHELMTEIDGDARFLVELEIRHKNLDEIIVDESNHDQRLEKYVREGKYRSDGFNARLGLQLEDRYLQHREETAKALENNQERVGFSLYEYAVRKYVKKDLIKTNWVYDGQSRIINDVEVGHHGHRGTNGSRGSKLGFVRLGRKISVGHGHSPTIRDGLFVAGVMAERQSYNVGPSSWAISHILQYANGKRCIITLTDGHFTSQN